jgi:hypothetical protein
LVPTAIVAGAVCGDLVAEMSKRHDRAASALILTVVASVAVFGCLASALRRWLEAWRQERSAFALYAWVRDDAPGFRAASRRIARKS